MDLTCGAQSYVVFIFNGDLELTDDIIRKLVVGTLYGIVDALFGLLTTFLLLFLMSYAALYSIKSTDNDWG